MGGTRSRPEKTIAEDLRESKNFAQLATVYRHIGQFLEGVKKAAPSVPNKGLDPTIKALENNLQELRNVGREITGYDVSHDQLMLNFGDEFGAAPAGTGVDTSDIQVLKGYAAAQPFKDGDLTNEMLAASVLGRPARALYGSNALSGVTSLVTRGDFDSAEGRRVYDAASSPLWRQFPNTELRLETSGCFRQIVNNWIVGTVVALGLVGLALLAWFLFGSEGDDDGAGSITFPEATSVAGRTTPAEPDATGPFDGFSATTQGDLTYFSPTFAGFDVAAAYVTDDPEGDQFTSFGDDVVFEDPLAELTQGMAFRFKMNDELAAAFGCSTTTDTGMDVACAPGVTGTPREGEYVAFIGSVDTEFADNFKTDVEYKFSAFIEDRGRTVAFPDGDPRPEFPNNTLIRTNSYIQLQTIGGDGWALNTRWSDGGMFAPWETVPRASSALQNVRGAIGGNTFMFVVPGRLYSDMTYFNVGTEAHTASVDYAPDNVTQDVLGATPRDMKPMLWDLYTMVDVSEEGAAAARQYIRDRLPAYENWIASSDAEEIVGHLHYSALQRWGDEQCIAHFSTIPPDDTFRLNVREIRGPITWRWEIYDQFLGNIPNVYEVDAALTQGGTTRDVTAHFAWDEDDDDVRIFSPCITLAEATPDDATSEPATASPSAAAVPEPYVASIKAAMLFLEEWRRTGNGAEQFNSLHPISIAYWGEATCRTFYDTQIGADPTFKFVSIGDVTGPTPYTYMAVGVTIGTADAYSVQAETTVQGGTQTYTWRFGWDETRDRILIFQACAR